MVKTLPTDKPKGHMMITNRARILEILEDRNASTALASALERYLDHEGMPDDDEDEPILEQILEALS